MPNSLVRPLPGKHLTVVGLGNIGSFLVEFVCRIPGVSHISLIDNETYTVDNVFTQRIDSDGVGLAKVDVQASRINRLAPGIEVRRIKARLEDVALGRLRCDVMLGCVDSRAARIALNRTAWRLGVPYLLDAGVNGDQLLTRLSATAPGAECSCLECSFGRRVLR